MSLFEVARALKRDPKTIYKVANNQQLPSLVLAFQIDKYTEGGVAPEMWLGTELGRLLWYNDGADWERFEEDRRRSHQRLAEKRAAARKEGSGG